MRVKELITEGGEVLPWKQTPAKMEYEQLREWVGHNAIRFINQEFPIWRGVPSDHAEGLYNATTLKRNAANTLNYMNLWLSNHQQWSSYPPRNKSFICTTDEKQAEDYGEKYVVIPQDSAKIGVCPKHDLWYSFWQINSITNPSHMGMDAFMAFTNQLTHLAEMAGNPEHNWDLFTEMLKKVDQKMVRDGIRVGAFRGTGEIGTYFLKFMLTNECETVFEAFELLFNPKQNGFMIEECKNFSIYGNREVWMSGGILLLEEDTWHKIARDFHL